ncbi:outer membrane protein assembly factor BamB family protein, partial [Haloferax denitrificans]
MTVVSLVAWVPVGAAAVTNGADISHSTLSVTPTTLYEGSAVTVNVTVENTGASQQPYNTTLTVDGAVVAYQTGTLNAGATKQVTFTKTLWGAGTYDVAAGGLAAQTVTVDAANAKFHGGPGNLGYYPNQEGPLTEPTEAWNISDGSPQVMQPTIVGDTLYTAFHDGGSLYALDPETGAEKWNATPGGSSGSTWTTPAYANGVLYLGSNDYKLHAINATDGTELWNYTTQTNVRSAPAVVDGVVYFGSNDGNLTAVDADTGDELWYYTMYQPILVESNPAVVDGVVYVSADDDNLTALNATTGTKIWNYTLLDGSQSDPTVANDTVFVGSDTTPTGENGSVYAINATDGTERWNYSIAGDVDSSQVYADGVVYAGSRGGELVALDATDGSRLWNASGSDFRGAPVVAGDVLYVSDYGDSTVHAFNATDGTELWSYASPVNTLYPTPLAWNGYLYYGSGSKFHALTEPAPAVSAVNATNPSGQNLSVSFDSSQALTNVSVSVSGPSSTTFTEADFAESGSGPYTYTLASPYETGSDGTYTVAVDTAKNADGQDGAASESDSVTIDTVAPAVDAGANATVDEDVALDFNATATDAVGVASTSWDFGDGSANATGKNATHTFADPGTYTATFTATDAAGTR